MPRRNSRPQSYARYQPPKRSCGGKVHYQNRHAAQLAAEEVMIMQPGLHLDAYKCLACGGWHLTSRQD